MQFLLAIKSNFWKFPHHFTGKIHALWLKIIEKMMSHTTWSEYLAKLTALMHLLGQSRSFMKVNRSLTANYRSSQPTTNSCFRNKSVVNMRKHSAFSSSVIKWQDRCNGPKLHNVLTRWRIFRHFLATSHTYIDQKLA